MIRKIFGDWELKAASLVIAVALWAYTSGQVRVERTLSVAIRETAIENLPADHQIVAISPREFTVTLSVPSERLDSLRSESLAPRIVLRRRDGGPELDQAFSLTSRFLGLPSDVRVVATEPKDLREVVVRLQASVEDAFPADLPVIEGLPPGISSEVHVDPPQLRLRAIAARMDALRQAAHHVRFHPVQLSGVDPALRGERVERVLLQPEAVEGVVAVQPAMATIRLLPVSASRQEVELPVDVLTPRDFALTWRLNLDRWVVPVTLRGPENLLRQLKPETDLSAFVTVRPPFQAGKPIPVQVNIVGPPWLTWDPATVTLTVQAIAQP